MSEMQVKYDNQKLKMKALNQRYKTLSLRSKVNKTSNTALQIHIIYNVIFLLLQFFCMTT